MSDTVRQIQASSAVECTNYFMRHTALPIGSDFASAAKKYHEKKLAQKAFDRANPQHERFKKLFRVFTSSSKIKEIQQFNIDRKFRWEDVQSEADQLIQAYMAQPSFRQNPIRFLSRSFTHGASTLEVLLKFIPNGEYTSIFCGALTLIFNAAKRMETLRERVSSCFATLPMIVQEAKEYRELYSDNEELWQAAEDLYLAILEGIEAMLQWMDEAAFKKAVKSFFQQDVYGKRLEDQAIKAGIEYAASNFRGAVDLCLHKSVRKIEILIGSLVTNLASREGDCEWIRSTPHHTIMVVKQTFIDVYRLQEILDADKNLVSRDMTLAISDAQRVSSSAFHAKAMSLLQHDMFHQWFTSSSSEILVVNGCMELTPEQETASPLTTVTCALYGFLAANPNALPLLYLCGQHSHPEDKYSRLNGMLRCLNAQLLLGNPECVDTTDFDHPFVHDLETNDLSALCKLLCQLVMGSPRQAVFILLDGFTFIEGSTPQEELSYFVQSLLYLKNSLQMTKRAQHRGPVLKIMLTNPTSCVYVNQWLQNNVLDLSDTMAEAGFGQDAYEASVDLLGFENF